MFYLTEVNDVVRVPPSRFRDDLKETIADVVNDEKVGFIDKEIGVILGVVKVNKVGEADVVLGDGAAYVDSEYTLIAFKPEMQNVYEGEVKDVAEFGGFIGFGPFDGLIHVSQIMNDFINFDPKNLAFVGRDSGSMLAKNDVVVAKLVSLSLKDAVTQSKIGFTMRQEGLGKTEWIEKTLKDKEKGIEPKATKTIDKKTPKIESKPEFKGKKK